MYRYSLLKYFGTVNFNQIKVFTNKIGFTILIVYYILGPYPLTARAGECSDMGLRQLTDVSICNQTVLNYFKIAVDDGYVFETLNDTYHLPGCNVAGGLWAYFNYAPTGKPYYKSHAVCVAGRYK